MHESARRQIVRNVHSEIERPSRRHVRRRGGLGERARADLCFVAFVARRCADEGALRWRTLGRCPMRLPECFNRSVQSFITFSFSCFLLRSAYQDNSGNNVGAPRDRSEWVLVKQKMQARHGRKNRESGNRASGPTDYFYKVE